MEGGGIDIHPVPHPCATFSSPSSPSMRGMASPASEDSKSNARGSGGGRGSRGSCGRDMLCICYAICIFVMIQRQLGACLVGLERLVPLDYIVETPNILLGYSKKKKNHLLTCWWMLATTWIFSEVTPVSIRGTPDSEESIWPSTWRRGRKEPHTKKCFLNWITIMPDGTFQTCDRDNIRSGCV